MILDSLSLANRYHGLSPLLRAGFNFLSQANLSALPSGRHAIDGERLFVLVNDEQGRGSEGARLEAHRSYIDIQLALAGTEIIGWRALADCSTTSEPYDAGRDIAFFADRPDVWLALPPGQFAVFFPEDAHAPLAGVGAVRKAVVKAAVEPLR